MPDILIKFVIITFRMEKKSQIILQLFHYHLEGCTDILVSVATLCAPLKLNSEIHFLPMGLWEKTATHQNQHPASAYRLLRRSRLAF